MYAAGGGDGIGNDWLATVDPITDRWSDIAPMSTVRMGAAMAGVGHCLYVTGGLDRRENTLSSVEMYDSRTGTWSTVKSMKKPRECHGIAAV